MKPAAFSRIFALFEWAKVLSTYCFTPTNVLMYDGSMPAATALRTCAGPRSVNTGTCGDSSVYSTHSRCSSGRSRHGMSMS